jgi:hypothetical protein
MCFIHFTDIPKLGINPKYTYNTPQGIYGYPLREIWSDMINKTIPFRGDAKYVFLFKFKGNRYLDIEKYSEENYETDIRKLVKLGYKDKLFEKTGRSRGKSTYWNNLVQESKLSSTDQGIQSCILMNFLRKLSIELKWQNKTSIWTKILLDLGYSAIMDFSGKGVIHKNEPTQAVIFGTKYIDVIEMFHNKRYWTKPYITDLQSIYDAFKDDAITLTSAIYMSLIGYFHKKKVVSIKIQPSHEIEFEPRKIWKNFNFRNEKDKTLLKTILFRILEHEEGDIFLTMMRLKPFISRKDDDFMDAILLKGGQKHIEYLKKFDDYYKDKTRFYKTLKEIK